MNYNNEQALDLCFEIEGLIALMIKREADVPEGVESLLRQKIIELGQIYECAPCSQDTTLSAQAIAQSTELEEKEDADVSDQPSTTIVDENVVTEVSQCSDPDIEPAPVALTLNDKFRFKRELFGNNAAELSDALDVVNAVSCQAELEDYFYNDLCWDPENPDVKDFMLIASARFKK